MNCEWVKANAIAYVYDEMPDDARYELERHTERCESCAREVSSARAFHQVMSAVPVDEPSPNLLAASRMKLQEALETTEQARGWQRFTFDPFAWLHQMKFAPALAVVLLMVGFGAGVFTTWRMGPKGPVNGPDNDITQAKVTDPIASIRGITQEPGTNRVTIQYDSLQPQQVEGSLDDARIQQLLLYAARNNQNSGLRMDSVDLLMRKPEDDRIREALIFALRYDTNPGVRLKALEGLRAYVRQDVRVRDAVLEALMRDSNSGVRTEAIQMLQTVTADSSVRQALGQLAQSDPNEYIRKQAGTVLTQLPEID
jgi:hypothetical protein